ncbi:hypothetical protein FRC04_004137 [Tulasnella sp. 424]|nr:hypothetical protein FRC04_004137 [Tulasnella sp. 424]
MADACPYMGSPLPPTMMPIARLQSLLKGLPEALPIEPEGTRFPLQLDGELITEEGWYVALNQALHATFGHHSQGIQIRERGPALLSITTAMEQTIINDANSRELVELWAKDIAEAAMTAGVTLVENPTSTVPRKRTANNKSDEEENEEESEVVEKEGPNSSQDEDMQNTKPKRAKQVNNDGSRSNAGRKPDKLVSQVIASIPDAKSVRCVGKDCTKTYAARDRKRILKHAVPCLGITAELRSQISATLASKSPSAVYHNTLAVAMTDPRSKSSSPMLKPSDSVSQAGTIQSPGVGQGSEAASDGVKAARRLGPGVVGNSVMANLYQEAKKIGSASRNTEINKALMSWMTCLGLPPTILSSLYSKHFFGILGPHWKVPSSMTYATNMLPSEASYVRSAVLENICQFDILTVSFDGWMSR